MKSQRAFAKHCSKFVGSSSSSSYPPSPATRICLAVVTRVVLEEIKSRNLSDPNYFLSVSFLFIFVIRRESQEVGAKPVFARDRLLPIGDQGQRAAIETYPKVRVVATLWLSASVTEGCLLALAHASGALWVPTKTHFARAPVCTTRVHHDQCQGQSRQFKG